VILIVTRLDGHRDDDEIMILMMIRAFQLLATRPKVSAVVFNV
jgi:hypothetical protein